MPKKTFALADLPDGDDELRARLAELTSAELSEARDALQTEFDKQFDAMGEEPTQAQLDSLEKLGAQMTTLDGVKEEKDRENAQKRDRMASLRDKVSKPKATDQDADAGDDGDEGEGGEGGEAAVDVVDEPELVTATSEEVLTAAIATAVESAVTSAADAWLKPARDLNSRIRFGSLKQFAPDAKVKEANTNAVITASANIPGFTQGGQIESIDELGRAMHQRAKMLPIGRTGTTEHVPIASLQREFTYTLDKMSTYEDFKRIIEAATDIDVLTAAGGWCAPSEITYDFYNIVCEDGMWDVPTIGLNRGGVQYPISPSFGDLAGQEGIVWTWTEQDDIDAVDSASVVKPCVRLECPDFLNRRKDCDGFCVTAGNLVDYAYPELVANWLRLVMAIRAHATNARLLDIAINGGGSGDDIGPAMPVNHAGLLGNVTAKLLTSIELSITDYREKFAMCDDAVLEGVFPRWAQMVIRADLANREDMDFLAVTDAQIADWFNVRDVRAQFVGDWQVRTQGYPGAATALTELPPEMDYLLYPAGTYVKGSGMTLDLGVVRDSVLNETNDHTAAWTEECYALLKPGHESRLITVDVCAAGNIGSRSIVCA